MTTRRELLVTAGILTGATVLNGTPVSAAISSQPASPIAGDYAHPEWLVDAGWLQEHLADPSLRVVALQPADDFANGHIPGSAQIDWKELEIDDTSEASLETWRRKVAGQMAALGIAPADTVVIYDPETLWGVRVWWVLDQLGHMDKRILNGGYAAWTADGGAIETGASSAKPAGTYVFTPDEGAIATIDEVKAAVADGTATFVDARKPDEYAAGHIPGAINIPYSLNAVDGSPRVFRNATELLAMYADAGVKPGSVVIPYCTSGVRSAVTFFSLRLIGYEQVSLFTGSWNEWSSDPSLPVSVGDAP